MEERKQQKEMEDPTSPANEAVAALPTEKWFQKLRLDEMEQKN